VRAPSKAIPDSAGYVNLIAIPNKGCSPIVFYRDLGEKETYVGATYSTHSHISANFSYTAGSNSSIEVGYSNEGKDGTFTGDGSVSVSTNLQQTMPGSSGRSFNWYQTVFSYKASVSYAWHVNGQARGSGQQCVSQPPDKRVTMGLFNLKDYGNSSVTVASVTLANVHGLAIGRAWLAPIIGLETIGVTLNWPPTGRAWAQRIPADGAVIKPRQELNLVFPVWRTTSETSTANVAIACTSKGNRYVLTEGFRLKIVTNCLKSSNN